MMPEQWVSPCGNQCTNKYSALTQIPWRVFCKKGCSSEEETWEESRDYTWQISGFEESLSLSVKSLSSYQSSSWHVLSSSHKLFGLSTPGRVMCTWSVGLENCNLMCYKDPVLKDQQWSAYIDRSPGAVSYSAECFHACVSGCGYKFDVKKEKVDEVTPSGRPMPAPVEKPRPQPEEPIDMSEDILGTSA
ncbi:hypothetical protein V8G54_034114 [Vigna mungo]|uniref:Uncharacterized protein n=1 Tax=Vigna mungo TaxID=3915 RepID=A0AAQ3MPK6_VIGMU